MRCRGSEGSPRAEENVILKSRSGRGKKVCFTFSISLGLLLLRTLGLIKQKLSCVDFVTCNAVNRYLLRAEIVQTWEEKVPSRMRLGNSPDKLRAWLCKELNFYEDQTLKKNAFNISASLPLRK